MTTQRTGLQKRRLTWYLGLTQQILSSCPCANVYVPHSNNEDTFSSVTCSTQSPYNNMLGKTASETGEDTTSMVYWVQFPWDNYQSTVFNCAHMNTFQPLPFAYSKHTDTKDITLSDVGGGTCSIIFLDTHERLLSVSGTHLLSTCPSNNDIASFKAFKYNEFNQYYAFNRHCYKQFVRLWALIWGTKIWAVILIGGPSWRYWFPTPGSLVQYE